MIASEEQARAFVAARCDREATARLDYFARLLTEESLRQNLISANSTDHLWQRHIADSAQLLDHSPAGILSPWLDLGSGAGFPGLVIAVMRPDWPITLVESRRLRIDWLNHVVQTLRLENCSVLGARLEVVDPFPAGVISARAFAPLPKLLRLARPFSTADTVWLLPKGRSAAQEVADLPVQERRMFHVEQSVSDGESGIVIGRTIRGTGR
ncbi:MAG: 16S rRNA (guanine(527)-N(7))-methyltransferase RsmG [Tsuneonella sp.]